ncbi:MAG: hypothetical protein JWP26_1918 [Devosia sp.]|uniref:7-cyano-7-deazaguanine synthase n=1 Tax=Devosia sp. TaxID=1871048 RepID=UPI0026262D8E|nr:7-cyano-7-deazaguanine synthase [Devosia sp.]MDB5586948.1 hypothetical protein [Devosia sp.]
MNDEVTIVGRSGFLTGERVISARLGEHIRANPEPIAQHSLTALASISEDVAVVAETVALADRILTRRRSECWMRHLHLTIPVWEVAAFTSAATASLEDTLAFLTGDNWTFEFSQRGSRPMRQDYLPLTDTKPRYIVPYSGGLDSFAQARLLEGIHGFDSLLRVNAGTLQSGVAGAPLLSIPRRFHAGHPRELTYRTRPFVYFSIAAIAAATLEVEAIVVGENGQGALGPSFARFGNEWPFRSTHPGFIHRLQGFLTQLFQKNVRFDQPQLWRTKGEVLGELKDRNLLDGWEGTTSCSARPLQRHGNHGCGICGGCILRQTAVHAAGLVPANRTSFNLSSESLTLRSSTGHETSMTANERDIISHSCLSMDRFATLPLRCSVLAREVTDLPVAGAAGLVSRLSGKHSQEWNSMIASLPRDAWISRQFLSE